MALIRRAWVTSVVGYSLLRFVLAWGALATYGVNPWIFGLIDVATAAPYALAMAEVTRCAATSEWNKLSAPTFVAVVMFFAPYGYLWLAADTMPGGVRVAMILFVAAFFFAAIAGAGLKAMRLRQSTAPGGGAPATSLEATS